MKQKLWKRMQQAALTQLAIFALPLGLFYLAGYRVLLIDLQAPAFMRGVAIWLLSCVVTAVVAGLFYTFYKGSFHKTAAGMVAPGEKGITEVILFRLLCGKYGFRGGFIFLLACFAGVMVIAVPFFPLFAKKILLWEIVVLIYLAASFLSRRLVFRMALPEEKFRLSRRAWVVLSLLIIFPAAGALLLVIQGVREEGRIELYRSEIRLQGGYPTLKELNEYFSARSPATPALLELVRLQEKTPQETFGIPYEVLAEVTFEWKKSSPEALEEAGRICARQRHLTELADRLLSMPEINFSWPLNDLRNYDTRELRALRVLGRLERIWMELAAWRGDTAQAMRNFHEMGMLRRHLTAQPILINFLIGAAVEEMRAGGMMKLLNTGAVLTDAQLKQVIGEMERAEKEFKQVYPVVFSIETVSPELYHNPSGFSILMKNKRGGDFMNSLDNSILMKPGTFWAQRFDSRVMVEKIAGYLKVASRDYYEMPSQIRHAWKAPGGAFTSALVFPSLGNIVLRNSTVCGTMRQLKIMAALELYRRKHGDYPESLAVLCPEFLHEVPLDPFDGKPMRYRKKTVVIPADWDSRETVEASALLVYSIWHNGRDDGGNIIWYSGVPKERDYGLARILE